MNQRQARVLFTECMARLLHYALEEGGLEDGEEIVMGEGYVALTDGADGDHDGPHKRGGAHYMGTAMDLTVYRRDDPIKDGADPAYQRLGKFWMTLHSLCRWGGAWQDGNHFGILFNGRA